MKTPKLRHRLPCSSCGGWGVINVDRDDESLCPDCWGLGEIRPGTCCCCGDEAPKYRILCSKCAGVPAHVSAAWRVSPRTR